MSADGSLLIHIGYHKTASTWLQKTVFKPENGFFQPFELHELYENVVLPNALSFECWRVQGELETRLSSAPEGVLIPVLSHERLSGDPYAGSRDSKEIGNRLHSSFPNAKVLIVVREQFELISSLYKTYIVHGGKAKLEDFIRPKSRQANLNEWFDFKTYCYDKLIEHYIGLFGRDNVLVVAYEDLKNDNQRFFNVLCKFSGASDGTLVAGATDKHNASLSELGSEMLRLLNLTFGMFCAYPLEVSNNKRWRLARSAIFRLDKINKQISPKGRLIKRTRELLAGNFRDSNAAVQAYVSYDLGRAGYEL